MAFYTNQSTKSLNREISPWSFTLKDDGPTRWEMLRPYDNTTPRVEEKIQGNRNPLNIDRERPVNSEGFEGRARVPNTTVPYSSQGPLDSIEQRSTRNYLTALDQSGIQDN